MRFNEFKTVLKEAENNVVIIGDSIAVGINGGQTVAGRAVGGVSPQQVLGFVQTFVQSGKAKGATVILSSGASNGTYERPDGQKQTLNMGPINQQLKLLKDAGASVALIGTGSAKSKTFTNQYGTYFVNFESEKVNEKLAAAAAATGATFLGPLEDFDPGLNSGKGDGIHPYGGYTKLKQAGSAVAAPTVKPTPGSSTVKPTPGSVASQAETLNVGPPFEIADSAAVKEFQKSLRDLGYSVGSTGIDGKYGPRTAAAVAAFKKDYKLSGNGNNVDVAMKKMIDDVKTGKVAKVETPTQVAKVTGALPPLPTDAVTQGKVGEVLNFIARFESRGNYNIILGGDTLKLTSMTIAQIYNLQQQMLRQGKESSAVGRYQYIGTTLREMVNLLGFDINKTKFNEKTQDAIAIADLRRRAGLDNWLSGSLSNEKFLERLSRIWAGLPSPSKGGASFYSGVGSNAAGTGLQAALGTLQSINAGTAVA